jgi:hypothetical protein
MNGPMGGLRYRAPTCLAGAGVWLIALTSTIFAQRPPATPAPDPLAGSWEHADIHDGIGTRSMLVFFADGAFSHTMTAATISRYRFGGGSLLVSPPNGPKMEMMISITGDTLTLMGAGVFQKLGRDPAAAGDTGLVGRWSGRTTQGAHMTDTFSADGTLRQEITIGGEVGRYEVAGEKIVWTVQLPKKSRRTTGFLQTGDKLRIITPDENTPMEYARSR